MSAAAIAIADTDAPFFVVTEPDTVTVFETIAVGCALGDLIWTTISAVGVVEPALPSPPAVLQPTPVPAHQSAANAACIAR
ncbi:MAG: hypothetical protein EXR79_03130 [Myxococcales bacterium]|nr:hypothetical protein [Myxococcales bacterium]